MAYAIYQLEFDLDQDEGLNFEVDEMEAIQNHYTKHQALLTLKQENVIRAISFVN